MVIKLIEIVLLINIGHLINMHIRIGRLERRAEMLEYRTSGIHRSDIK